MLTIDHKKWFVCPENERIAILRKSHLETAPSPEETPTSSSCSSVSEKGQHQREVPSLTQQWACEQKSGLSRLCAICGKSRGSRPGVWILDITQMWCRLAFIYNYFPHFMTVTLSWIMLQFQGEISVELNSNSSISHRAFISKWPGSGIMASPGGLRASWTSGSHRLVIHWQWGVGMQSLGRLRVWVSGLMGLNTWISGLSQKAGCPSVFGDP